ncbi:hypothetical protein FSS13T_23400 [Flavobacterium saliperosum S13]|uniref:TonB-dependent outer membrane receptor, SusC/RagA subfamily, signature region n=2 Tax=Flavobacterium saliperosum TaxID=329186 RepID=A0A1G4VMV9_9FLAO|nr:MG2 domain-containing protein [Flavobacterium saliperosum]ESU23610.1 hypothetical protein FSS13T_23400 [Flavobacterium saliperosum S13]SCX09210.1 TonB-dependent outer membrane receptor, SusC/RagA subfamily, signature region [Flavobacterium saliperosum]
MKKEVLIICLFFSLNLFAQNFDGKWEKVIELEKEGKIQSANEEVQKIYSKAKRRNDETQIIKTFFYSSKFIQTLEEEAQLKILFNLNKEIKELSSPSQSVLKYIYAKCLAGHLSKNRYSIQKLTATDSIYSEDFRTWPVNILEKEINTAYNSCISKEELLKNTPLVTYEMIFDFEKYEDFKETSLYDFLAAEVANHYSEKIDYSKINHSDLELKRDLIFDVSSKYQNLSFDFIQEANLKQYLTLHQKLESGSKKSQEHQFQRIRFLKDAFFYSDNDSYLKVLTRFQKNHLYNENLQKVLLEKAQIYSNSASKESKPQNLILAVATYDSILNLSRSDSYKKASNAKNEITRNELNLKLLKQIYNKENSRAHISYKNIDNVTISFYKIKQTLFNYEYDNSQKKDSIVNLLLKNRLPFKKATYKLENKKDYFQYSTEVLLPQLETGHYLVYMESEQKSDSLKTKAFDYETLTVSNLTLLSHTKEKTVYFQALDRKTGIPVEDVKIEFDDFVLHTNEMGKADVKFSKKSHYFDKSIFISKNNDSLYIAREYIRPFNYDDGDDKETTEPKIEFYLDRAIYRPGQTVFYKGIAFWKKNNQIEVVPDLTVRVLLEDANGHEIKEIEVKTNEFGSFSGEFLLPKTGLTGEYTLAAEEPNEPEKDALYDKKEEEHPFWDNLTGDDPEITFQVEEYKRPKFEITFSPIKKTYTVDQKVTVKGKARSFAGSAISDSKVTYKIVRNSYSSYRYSYPSETNTLEEGETKTDAEGNFIIEFTAEPNYGFDKKSLPVFNYDVAASITDINGETRNNQTTVKVGYHSLRLQTIIPRIIETDKKSVMEVDSKNLNHEFVPVKGQLHFYSLSPIHNKWKNRTWSKPEIKTIPESEFDQLFPYEKNENDDSPKEKLIFTKTIDTEKDKKIALDFLSFWKTGNYKVVFSAKDSLGNPVESTSTFKLFQKRDKNKPSDELFAIKQLNLNPKKDGFVKLEINSNFADLYISSNAFYKGNEYHSNEIQLENHTAVIQIPIKKDFKNGINIQFQTIFENVSEKKQFTVYFLDEKSNLQFKTESLRNKIEPGSNENWVFKILGSKANETEILASMYDSSLDQFTKKIWKNLDVQNDYINYGDFETALGFRSIYSTLRFPTNYYYRDIDEKETSLIWFGFNFSNANDYYAKKQYEKLIQAGKVKIPTNSKSVSGVVTEGGLPLPGVSVVVKGTTRGTQTDMDGYYSIDVAQGEELVFSFIGMKDVKLKVNSKVHNVAMPAESAMLENVVVTALGIKKRQDEITSSNQVFSAKELTQAANPNIVQSLAGKVEGLQITPSNGVNANTRIVLRGNRSISGNNQVLVVIDGVISDADALTKIDASELLSSTVLKGAQGAALYGEAGANGVLIITTKKSLQEVTQVQARKNLNETAFFFPHLKTDKDGKVTFSFTSPEALTQWKLRLLAHDKRGVSGYFENTVITQKDLMVTPNFPRFLREKDTVFVTAKVANLTYEAKTGIAALQLFDATTMETIDAKVLNTDNIKNFTIPARGNTVVTWRIVIPEGLQGVQYKVLAKAGNYSDGEENILPVLTNNMLVTESIPLWVRGGTKKKYVLENLKNNTSTTLRNHMITLEYTSNPTWLALQSLPYLMEYEHECSEQTFALYYANVLASEIINSNPKIAAVFNAWSKAGKSISKLEQNEELKSIILAETPWIRDAQSEEERKKNLALLFDLEKMKGSLQNTLNKLTQKQKSSGGFAWFDGADESEYITRHILAGFGHLSKMKINAKLKEDYKGITEKGVMFMDIKFMEAHKRRTAALKGKEKLHLLNPYSDLHYLYTRSFYLESNPLTDELKKTTKAYIDNIIENWLNYSLYEKGMAALTLHRFGENVTAKKITESLKETASNNEDWGMYWIENKVGWYWYQAPIETQALLIEAFAEINNDTQSVDAMKVWLLKNKQNKNWPTTKATTEAIYALLMQGNDWLSVKDNTIIKMGDEKIVTKKMSETEKEAETGYIKMNWKPDEIKKEMAALSVENKSNVPGYGGFYWQYFEDLDKIKANSGSILSVSKELYLKKSTTAGELLQRITDKNPLKTGDLVTVRLIITAKENMEYVHLKDMRAAGFEPVDVISTHHWKDGLSYYQSTKDMATHFFFDTINKGTYVLEYDVRVNNKGDFSNGITTIQSMYAPEFTSHSKGIRVSVKE